MHRIRFCVAGVAGLTLLFGSAWIIWNGRPVVQQQTSSEDVAKVSSQGSVMILDGVYTLEEVATHALQEDCWTTIRGAVYDLTTWVSRHPGGENPIVSLCGIDGTERFEKKHGDSKNAQAAIVLLKIGTLE